MPSMEPLDQIACRSEELAAAVKNLADAQRGQLSVDNEVEQGIRPGRSKILGTIARIKKLSASSADFLQHLANPVCISSFVS